MTALVGRSLKSWSPEGEAIIRAAASSHPARAALLAVAGMVLAGCSLFGSQPAAAPTPAASAAPASPSPVTSPAPLAVWVLYPLGVHIHKTPALGSDNVVTTEEQGVELDIQATQVVAGKTWYQIVSHNTRQDKGWVLDDPTLIIPLSVAMHIDTTYGYSLLYPANWSLQGDNPVRFLGPPADQRSLMVQVAPTDAQLPTTPISAGNEVNSASVEVYGQTVVMKIYQAQAGGFEALVRFQFEPPGQAANPNALHYLFDFRQPSGGSADTTLFVNLLGGVKIAS